jgi:hypothetical protein
MIAAADSTPIGQPAPTVPGARTPVGRELRHGVESSPGLDPSAQILSAWIGKRRCMVRGGQC